MLSPREPDSDTKPCEILAARSKSLAAPLLLFKGSKCSICCRSVCSRTIIACSFCDHVLCRECYGKLLEYNYGHDACVDCGHPYYFVALKNHKGFIKAERELYMRVAKVKKQRGGSSSLIFCCEAEVCSDTWSCNTCGKNFCKFCLAELQNEHVCSPDDVLTAEKIRESTKPCPSCRVLIERSFGCNHMFCTHCFASFDWLSGKRISNSSNPLYREHLANRDRANNVKVDHLVMPHCEVEDRTYSSTDVLFYMVRKFESYIFGTNDTESAVQSTDDDENSYGDSDDDDEPVTTKKRGRDRLSSSQVYLRFQQRNLDKILKELLFTLITRPLHDPLATCSKLIIHLDKLRQRPVSCSLLNVLKIDNRIPDEFASYIPGLYYRHEIRTSKSFFNYMQGLYDTHKKLDVCVRNIYDILSSNFRTFGETMRKYHQIYDITPEQFLKFLRSKLTDSTEADLAFVSTYGSLDSALIIGIYRSSQHHSEEALLAAQDTYTMKLTDYLKRYDATAALQFRRSPAYHSSNVPCNEQTRYPIVTCHIESDNDSADDYSNVRDVVKTIIVISKNYENSDDD